MAALDTYTGPWTRREAAHLVRRTLFGLRPEDITTALAGTVSEAVDRLLASSPPPADPIAYTNSGAVTAGNEWMKASYDSGTEGQRVTFAQSWWIDIMLQQGFSLREKMTLFWANHLATGSNTVKDARYIAQQNIYLRANAFGNIKTIVRDITFDPAMLRYLSGNTNTKKQPNENYARELQELFTIGKGPEIQPGNYTNYTEADVKAAARVLTGWSDDATTRMAKFNAGNHDSTDKTFSAAYGNTVVKGGKDEAGARREIDDMLAMIFAQPATALYLVRKLYRFFVDYKISATTEATVIAPLADLLRSNNYDVKPVLRALFTSTHFYDTERIGCMIKPPIDLVLGVVRTFRPPDLFPAEKNKMHWAYRTLRKTMATAQQDLFNPPNVAGWPAYYQEPFFHEIWINADTLQKRVKYTNDMSSDGYLLDEAYEKSYIDEIYAASLVSEPGVITTLITEWAFLLFPVPLNDNQIEACKNVVLSGLPDYEWSVEWGDYVNDPTNDAKLQPVRTKLRALLRYMMGMAEHQIC